MALTETWLRVDGEPSCYLVNNYIKGLVNSRKSRDGGVMLQFCEEAFLIRELKCPFNEDFAAQFSYFDQLYMAIVLYSPPRLDKMVIVEQFELILDSLGSYKCRVIVCGDLKIDTPKSNMLTGKNSDKIEANGSMILSKNATPVTHESITCTCSIKRI